MKTHLCSFYLMRLPVRDDVVREKILIIVCLFAQSIITKD